MSPFPDQPSSRWTFLVVRGFPEGSLAAELSEVRVCRPPCSCLDRWDPSSVVTLPLETEALASNPNWEEAASGGKAGHLFWFSAAFENWELFYRN